MRRYIVLVLLVIASLLRFNSFGQKPANSVEQYYKLKNEAEVAIMDSNYTKAQRLYEQAFTYKKPNARELHNAMVVAFSLRDTQHFQQYYNQTILKGLTKHLFEVSAFFGSHVVDDPLYQYVAKGYDSLRAIADASQMPRLAALLDTIIAKDQCARSKNSGAIAGVDSMNRLEMAAFIDKYGFPGFNLVGYYDRQVYNQPRNGSSFWLIMWHARYSYIPLDAYALAGLRSGDFPPDDYAVLMDNKGEGPVYDEILPAEVTNGNVTWLLPANVEEINKKRAGIYLDKLEDHKRKLEFLTQKQRQFQFLTVWDISLNFVHK